MSRIGKKLIEIPKTVTATLTGADLKRVGGKGELALVIPRGVLVEVKDGNISVAIKKDEVSGRLSWARTAKTSPSLAFFPIWP